jgi:hypothetical protein
MHSLIKILKAKLDENGKPKYTSLNENNTFAILSDFINYIALDICLEKDIPFVGNINRNNRCNDFYNSKYIQDNKSLINQVLASEGISDDNTISKKYPHYPLYSSEINELSSGISGDCTSPLRKYVGLLNLWILQNLLLNPKGSIEEERQKWDNIIYCIVPELNANEFYKKCLVKKVEFKQNESYQASYCKE